jgi:putative phosphoribosyl transferase
MRKYHDRKEAGKILAHELLAYKNRNDVMVLALPRGGVPVAFEIAKTLHAPLDVFIVRKLGLPGHAELAMGALATGGIHIFNDDVLSEYQVSEDEIKRVIAEEQQELNRRNLAYRNHVPLPTLKNKTLILVDDGIATGATMRAAIKALRQMHPAKIIVAVPVMDMSLATLFAPLVDELICPLTPKHFYAVGAWYERFDQTEDLEVRDLLEEARVRV